MSRLTLHLFGPPRLEFDGVPVETERRKTLALLAYLAVTRQSHTRETLAALLWPETAPGRAYANLRQILWELNQTVGEGWVDANRDTVSLNLDADLWLDVAKFRLLLTSIGKLDKDCDRCVPLLTEATALYQDHFLAGLSLKEAQGFDEWVFFEAEGLRRDLARLLETLVHCLCGQGQAETAIPYARRLVALDPVHEETHRQLMKVYEQAGQHHAALRQYQECVRFVRDELGVEPEPQTTALYEEVRAGTLATRLVLSTPLRDIVDEESSEELRNPYKGLRAFQQADAPDFFGREALTERLIARLAESGEAARFLAVIGPSGSGKSSLVRAGLIPALRRGTLPNSERWHIVDMFPGAYPLEELEAALLRIAVNPPTSLLNQLQEDARGLSRAINRVLPGDGTELVLIIDQFEEVFTLVEDEDTRTHFLDSLHLATSDLRSRLRVIVTLRADFMDRPLGYAGIGELVRQRNEFILPLSPDDLQRAVVGPAKRVGLTVEPDLVAAIVREVAEEPGALPLLQYALTELFERRQDNRLTLAAYRASGSVTGALARRADDLYNKLDAASQASVRQAFLRLITLGEGIEDARRRVQQTELVSIVENPHILEHVIDIFSKHSLLTSDRDSVTGGPTVEVAHEALIRSWGRLRGWLDESRENLRVHRRLTAATTEWINARRDVSFLAAGTRLTQFEALAAGSDLALNREEQEYLQVSIAERKSQGEAEHVRQAREKKLEQRSVRFLRILVIVLILATLGALGLTGVAQSNAALAERNAAEARSLALASAAQLALNEGSIDQAITLAKSAQQLTNNPPPLAQLVLDEATYALGTRSIFQGTGKIGGGALASSALPLKFVMVAHIGLQNPVAVLMINGMQGACARLNASCQWLSDPDWSYVDIPKYWKQALTMNPDGIGTVIADPNLIRSSVQQAADRGIPVIAFNVADAQDTDPSLPALLFIGADEFGAGASNARRVFAEAKADGVTIKRGVCAIQDVHNAAVVTRCAGVKSVFDEQGVPLDQLPIDGNSTDAMTSGIALYFKANPETRAIFMLGPSPATALHQFMQQAGLKPRHLYATTHDTSPEIFQMIRDGFLLQTIDQQPYMQGFQTIMSLYLYRQYGLRPSGFINTSSVVDGSNVDLVTHLVEAGYR